MTELLADNQSFLGRVVTSFPIVAVAVVLSLFFGKLLSRRAQDAFGRYYIRKAVRYITAFIALVALAIVWRPFAGQIGVVLGLLAAGVAFAMQEVIGAVAGWFNVMSGRIFAVGDRIEMGGVRGDVIDITPLRTKILEMGSSPEGNETSGSSWVGGRQYTGRIVAVSNKTTFTEPVFNYSAVFDYIWEELTIPVGYQEDWRRAEGIVLEEVARASSSEGARAAIEHMTRRYPIPRAEVEPRVFVRATDNWVAFAARFVVPVRTARTVKDAVTRRIIERFEEAGIEVASETLAATVRVDETSDEGSSEKAQEGSVAPR
ncbi:MAG: mechanosensitive ion channel family protein [Actinomycetota bacterium]|nr:mechanosensitive ion channel family protein [Actinomycetota bacterium]